MAIWEMMLPDFCWITPAIFLSEICVIRVSRVKFIKRFANEFTSNYVFHVLIHSLDAYGFRS